MTIAQTGRRATIYCRISRDQTGLGAGVQRQEEACRALCDARGWTVQEVLIDNDISAYSGKRRPAWEKLLETMKSGGTDVVVAYHTDRLYRRVIDLLPLLDAAKGVELATVTSGDLDLSTPSGRATATIFGAMAQQEVEQKGVRQKSANAQRAGEGEAAWTHRPLGYNRDGTPHEIEAPLVREAYAAILRGDRLFTICKAWAEQGITTYRGNPWQPSKLSRFLRSPRNYGQLEYLDEPVGPGDWEPLVDEATWSAVRSRLQEKATGGNAPKTDSWLVGVATCATCDGRVWTNRTKTKVPMLQYVCPGGHLGLPVDWADGQVFLRVSGFLGDPEWREQWSAWVASRRGQQAEVIAELGLLEERLEALAEDYAAGLLTRQAMLKGTARVRERIAELEAERGPVEENGWSFDVEYLAAEIEQMTPDERRAWLRSVTDSVRLHRRGKGKRGLWADLVEVVPRTLGASTS